MGLPITESGMNRWGGRAFFLSAGEKFGAGRKIVAIHSTPMVYDRMLWACYYLFPYLSNYHLLK
jgi:hypothetical protein